MSDIDEKDYFRTVPKAVEYIHDHDPDSAVTEYSIRKAIKGRKIKFSRIGRRYYLSVRAIEDFYQEGSL